MEQTRVNIDNRVLAVNDKDAPRRRARKACRPIEKALLIRVPGNSRKRANLRRDMNFLAEQRDLFYAFQQSSSQCSLTLIADEQNRRFLSPEIVLQMVFDPSRVAHTAR